MNKVNVLCNSTFDDNSLQHTIIFLEICHALWKIPWQNSDITLTGKGQAKHGKLFLITNSIIIHTPNSLILSNIFLKWKKRKGGHQCLATLKNSHNIGLPKYITRAQLFVVLNLRAYHNSKHFSRYELQRNVPSFQHHYLMELPVNSKANPTNNLDFIIVSVQ